MKTLYDLLGALAEDDADSIRAAFRKAAKANHPDNNPDDMGAALRFRQIVRANAILSDKGQRAAYDRMLVIAQRRRVPEPKRGNFSRGFYALASGAISGATFSAAAIGIYLLFGYMSAASLVRNHGPDAPARAATAGIATGRSGASSATGQHAASGQLGAPGSRDGIKQASRPAPEAGALENSQQDAAKTTETNSGETIKPLGQAAAPSDAGAADAKIGGPSNDAGVKDARYYRERGMLAYRSGDLTLALIDYDLAISLDPGSSDSYIDRAIVLHRMGDLKRAFEDVAHAKRIDDSSKGKQALSTR